MYLRSQFGFKISANNWLDRLLLKKVGEKYVG